VPIGAGRDPRKTIQQVEEKKERRMGKGRLGEECCLSMVKWMVCYKRSDLGIVGRAVAKPSFNQGARQYHLGIAPIQVDNASPSTDAHDVVSIS
jgi:hypothetical protein